MDNIYRNTLIGMVLAVGLIVALKGGEQWGVGLALLILPTLVWALMRRW